MQAMKATIRNRSKLKAKSATDIEQQQMFKMKYHTWTKILTSFGDEEMNCALAEFLVSIIEHTEGLFKLAPERQPEDYDETVDGEIDSQLFPNFPILRQRAYYEKECQAEDDKSLKSMCEKIFPTHSALSPGLMVMTCACPRKVVYGISLMTSGESPQMIFDVIMSRFPPDYSPNIIYDNACKRVRKNLSCASASLNGNVFANPESFCWLPRRGSSLFEII